MASKTMLFKYIEGVLVAVHTADPPSDEDWREYVEYSRSTLPVSCNRTLAVTRGGGPDAKQRKMAQEVLANRPKMRVSIVTDSTLVRGIVTALSWFNPDAKAFSQKDLRDALKYLDIEGAAAAKISLEVARMQREL